MPYEDMQALVDKADWEGGWPSLISDYGLRREDLPPDAPEGLWDAIQACAVAYRNLEALVSEYDPY